MVLILSLLVIAVLALVLGIWLGIGAPGWKHRERRSRRRLQTRPLNPIAWGRRSQPRRRPHQR